MPLTFAIEDKGILPDRMVAQLAAAGGILPATEFVPVSEIDAATKVLTRLAESWCNTAR